MPPSLPLAAGSDLVYLAAIAVLVVLGMVVRAIVMRVTFRARMRRTARSEWGKGIRRSRDLASLAGFDPGPSDRFGPFRLDDATWYDLDLDAVFARLDRTRSSPGESVLAALIRRPLDDPARIRERADELERIEADAAGRTETEVELRRLGREKRPAVRSLLWGMLPERPGFVDLYTFLGFLPLGLAAAGLVFDPRLLLLAVPAAAVNMLLHYRVADRIGLNGGGIPYLVALVRTGARIGAVSARSEGALSPRRRECGRLARELRPVVRHGRMIAFGYSAGTGDLLSTVSEYIRILLLLDVRGYFGILGDLERRREEARELFLRIGELDALISVASWRRSLPAWCAPEFDTGPVRIEVEEGVHPLLDEPVPNSLDIAGRSVLVTGSNMAGKSTFLRMVGLASLLGQSLATCPARRFAGVPFRLATSIQHRDQVLEGRSFYLAEAERLLTILRLAEGATPLLVLLDEPLRGTNSAERVAACHEILNHLAARGVTSLVATHESRLAQLLERTWRPVHFTDYVTEEGLRFPYRLEEGISTTRNAIRLLRELGYPDDIVAPADRLAETLTAPA